MSVREYYYGSYQYDSAGLEPFLAHVAQFLDGTRSVPVTKAPSMSPGDLYFTFSDQLFRMFLEDPSRIKKPYESALKYGLRGHSKGGRNGVFLLRNQDVGMLNAIESLKAKCVDQIVQDLNCSISDLPDLKNVKIVCHEPSGERVVGVMNPLNGRAFFLGFGQY